MVHNDVSKTLTVVDSAWKFLSVQNVTPIVKCVVPMPGQFLENYTLYLFIIGFCVPTLIITCCYASILAKILAHRQRLSSTAGGHSQLPTVRVTVMIITLVLLYLVCWTPYWTMVSDDFPEGHKLCHGLVQSDVRKICLTEKDKSL
uniref:G-protein coupled receptors family 1 profile domain-containing protein n=1 Tax=Romanomermis culicivorax TaxID=13658 RepID=A0A915HI56_ROMCU